jgi:hypothetical protein
MVFVHKDKIVEPAKETRTQVRKLVEGSKTKISSLGPNILNQDYLKVKIMDQPEKEMFFKYASDSIYMHFGFEDGNPWFQSSQFKTEILDKDKNYKKGDRFEVAYNFVIASVFDYTGIRLVVERPYLYTVTFNGTVIQPEKGEYWLDPAFAIFNVEKLLKKGKNELRLAADPFSVNCETEPAYLIGNFGMEPATHGWKMVAPKPLKFGSWKSQGMPFYGQSVKYSKTVNTEKAGMYEIELGKWFGTVAAVNINGKEVGIIQALPYVFKVDLTPGENIIDVVVIGSLKNTLGPHHIVYPNGVGGRPDNFRRNVPFIQPPGSAYQMFDYGLMEDFKEYALE